MAIRSDICYATLATASGGFSWSARARLFDGQPVSPLLSFPPPFAEGFSQEDFTTGRLRASISGYQPKLSLVLDGKSLRPTPADERGIYILKPATSFRNGRHAPANEHLTMQIAEQVYGLVTAANAIVSFTNGSLAYLTRRFDVSESGKRLYLEDFASISEKEAVTDGDDYKYQGSYESIGRLIKRLVPAAQPALEQFFRLVVFNYLFSNGDAHLKNFSLLQTDAGDLHLSPAYDLLNTALHIDDTYFALKDGLLAPGAYHNAGRPGRKDFRIFAERLEVTTVRAERFLDAFAAENTAIESLVGSSFLPPNLQKAYLAHYRKRRKSLED